MYMIYQQYQTAIKNAYAGRQDLKRHVESAKVARQWLEALEIEEDLRNALVEPIRMLQETFLELQANQDRATR